MDTLANAPFDHVLSHINAIHNQTLQFNQQLNQQLHQIHQSQLQLMHANQFHQQQIQQHNQLQHFHNPFAMHQAIMQQAMVLCNM